MPDARPADDAPPPADQPPVVSVAAPEPGSGNGLGREVPGAPIPGLDPLHQDAAPAAGAPRALLAEPLSPREEPAASPLVLDLLAKAESQIASWRLTTPAGDNAWDSLRAVTELAPDDPRVEALRARIVDTYRRWAAEAEGRRQWDIARTYYQRALRVDPRDARITALLDGIERRQRTDRPAPF